MRIGIIYAMDNEGKQLIHQLKKEREEIVNNNQITFGTIGNNEVLITKSGIGKVNAAITAALLILKYDCDLLLNTGIAGGSKELNTGDVVLIEKATYSDFDLCNYGYKYGQAPGNPEYIECDKEINNEIALILKENNIEYKLTTLLSADSFRFHMSEIKNDINEAFACDMEGMAIIHTAYKFGKKTAVLRFISDILDSENHLEDYNKFEAEASKKSSLITLQVLNKLKG